MGFLGRKRTRERPPGATPEAVAAFWGWWVSVRSDIASSIAKGTVAEWVGEISSQVDAVHPQLAWELAAGSSSEHILVISAEGVAALRATAERVIRAAPAPDSTWAYASSRQPTSDFETAVLRLGRTTVELGGTRFVTAYDGERAEVDVQVYNPAFRELGGAAMQAVFLILDGAVGEDAVERWIGAIDLIEDEPAEGLTVDELRREIETRAATVELFWVVLGADGGDLVALARRPLKRAEFPLFDLRVDVTTVLVSPASIDVAQAIDEQLEPALGRRGAHLASVMSGGRRTSHYYCDSEAVEIEEIEAIVRPLAATEQVVVSGAADPAWEAIREYQ